MITRKRRSRAERARENRETLINAAAEIIHESGYEGATIAEVTRRAGLSLGSFYQYFESRDDLFHQILPTIGARLISVLAQESHDAHTAVEAETKAIKAYFDYVGSGSPIMRVFREAEVYAPQAYADHMNDVLARYTRTLRRRNAAGEFQGFDDRELEAVAVMLTAARVELFERFAGNGQDTDWICEAFIKIIKALSRGA